MPRITVFVTIVALLAFGTVPASATLWTYHLVAAVDDPDAPPEWGDAQFDFTAVMSDVPFYTDPHVAAYEAAGPVTTVIAGNTPYAGTFADPWGATVVVFDWQPAKAVDMLSISSGSEVELPDGSFFYLDFSFYAPADAFDDLALPTAATDLGLLTPAISYVHQSFYGRDIVVSYALEVLAFEILPEPSTALLAIVALAGFRRRATPAA
jgi:hypothetical protein